MMAVVVAKELTSARTTVVLSLASGVAPVQEVVLVREVAWILIVFDEWKSLRFSEELRLVMKLPMPMPMPMPIPMPMVMPMPIPMPIPMVMSMLMPLMMLMMMPLVLPLAKSMSMLVVIAQARHLSRPLRHRATRWLCFYQTWLLYEELPLLLVVWQ